MEQDGHYQLHVLKGTIELLTGMRIGGSDERLQIGGADMTCIRDAASGRPYIPGSSLKGRMRSCLEHYWHKTYQGRSGLAGRGPCNCAEIDCPICRVFGPHAKPDHNLGPSRAIVRDAPVMGEYQIETKYSTAIDRRNQTALKGSLRSEERIAPGAMFAFEIALRYFPRLDARFQYTDHEGNSVTGLEALKQVVEHALSLVQDTGIGAGISKGFGKVRIVIVRQNGEDWKHLRRRPLHRES